MHAWWISVSGINSTAKRIRLKTLIGSQTHIPYNPCQRISPLLPVMKISKMMRAWGRYLSHLQVAAWNMNTYKIRVLKFVQPERIPQGLLFYECKLCDPLWCFEDSLLLLKFHFAFVENTVSYRVRTRMIMSEKPYDGTVAMHYGEIEDGDFLSAEDYLPSLPNTVSTA